MRNQNFYYKIHNRKNFTEKLGLNQKYSSRIRTIEPIKLNSNYNSLENETSDCTSLNRINYSSCNEYNLNNFKNITKKKSNIMSNHKLTYVLTTNESSNFDEKSRRADLLKTLDFGEKSENYGKKYLQCFQSYTENREKGSFSNKLKNHRENLNKIVKLLNEANGNINKKNKNDINNTKENEIKGNINNNNPYYKDSNINHLNNDLFINNIESQKLLTDANKKNNFINLRDKFITNTYCCNKRNNKYIKKLKSLDRNLHLNERKSHSLMSNDSITNHNNLTNEQLRDIKYEKRNSEKDESISENNIISKNNDEEDNRNKIKTLRNEYKEISEKYLEITKQLDSIKNNDISYEDIIKNNSKTKDIINYYYKNNNDEENEKVFILMKLKLKNYEIIFKKMEQENKLIKKKFKKFAKIMKHKENLEEENNSLKEELNEMNINYQKLNEELQLYETKFLNINSFNKKIQDINKNLTKEKYDIKKDLDNTKKEYKELKIKYDKMIPQQNELISKLNEENNNNIKEIEDKYNYIDEENNNLKILLNNSNSKYKILEKCHNELKEKYNINEEIKNNIENKNNGLQNIKNK